MLSPDFVVAPSVGAWIEMVKYPITAVKAAVVSFVGAWIGIFSTALADDSQHGSNGLIYIRTEGSG